VLNDTPIREVAADYTNATERSPLDLPLRQTPLHRTSCVSPNGLAIMCHIVVGSVSHIIYNLRKRQWLWCDGLRLSDGRWRFASLGRVRYSVLGV